MFTSITHTLAVVVMLALAGCTELGAVLEVPLEPVHTVPVQPVDPPVPPPLELLQRPTYHYATPAPLPPRHALRVALEPSGALSLHDVQQVVVELEVVGGPHGARPVQAVFVTPQGLVWQSQSAQVIQTAGELQVVQFSLPVSATFIEDQLLSGRWTVTTLDEGLERATTSFELQN